LSKALFLFFLVLILFSETQVLSHPSETKPLRIISLYAAHSEVLIRLGARDQLVGVSKEETYDGPEVQGWGWPTQFSMNDNVEKFLDANPDIVLVSPVFLSYAPNLFETLRRCGIQIWSRQIMDAADLYDYWQDLGDLSGYSREAQLLIADFKAKIAPFEKNLAKKDKPGVFLEAKYREIKTFTPKSIPIWILELAGGSNVANDAQAIRDGFIYADYGAEKLLEKSSEIDVFISQYGPLNLVPLEIIISRDLYQVLPAFKNGRVYKIPGSLISRPTPSIYEGLLMMHSMIYPEG
jgi:iron complex transport system substrate-binding protein